MSEGSFASLNPSLLARKGGAKPAMRPQLAPLNPAGMAAANLEDLGWNDMGDKEPASHQHEAEVLHLTPEPANQQAQEEARKLAEDADRALAVAREPAVRKEREQLAERIAEPDLVPQALARKAPQDTNSTAQPRGRRSALGRGKRAAFTLRLDAERHLKLRLASTVKGRSAQQIVTEALDKLLDGMPEIDSLAAQVKQR
ncbi:hypothetical protein OAS19_01995 [Altererythrobacter sp.]|nr:hypothetical protein [Altererythrobacter sp.]